MEHGDEDESRGEPNKKRHDETKLLEQNTPKKLIIDRVKHGINKVLSNDSLYVCTIQEIHHGYILTFFIST